MINSKFNELINDKNTTDDIENGLRNQLKEILYGDGTTPSFRKMKQNMYDIFDALECTFLYMLEKNMNKDEDFLNAEIKFECLGDQNHFVYTDKNNEHKLICTQPKGYIIKNIYDEIDRFIREITSINEFFDVWYKKLKNQLMDEINNQRNHNDDVDAKLRIHVDCIRFKENEDNELDMTINYDMMIKIGILIV